MLKSSLIKLAVILSLGVLFTSQIAQAFSVTQLTYSVRAFEVIVGARALEEHVDQTSTLVSITKHPLPEANKNWLYDAEFHNADKSKCIVTVEISTHVPKFFIGNGLPSFAGIKGTKGKCLKPTKEIPHND